MAGLLDGVRVLDVTTVLAGPFAAYQLGLFGADVIKIEIPGAGDLAREMGDDQYLKSELMGAPFVAQNCGKRSITIDLKSERGKEILGRLVDSADVLLENMRPGVLDRLGFSWANLHERNPALIYCAVSGFGQTGPLADRVAYDQIIQGLAGMAAITGEPDGGPLRVGFPICDTLGGYAAAMSIAAALVRRGRDGMGTFLDVSMLETAMTAMGWAVSEQLISGREARRHGNHNAASSPSGSFRTGDGLINIAANTQVQFESVCRVVNRLDLVTDPRFATRLDRKRNRAALTAELESALAARSAVEWEAELAKVSVPAGQVLELVEALNQEQIRSRELLHDVDLGLAERSVVAVVGTGVHVDGSSLAPRSGPPPLGHDTDAVLLELGYSAREIEELRDAHAI